MDMDNQAMVDVHQAKQLLNQNPMIVYHGSPYIIEKPSFEKGKSANDYGKGFYLTANAHLANEWAVKNETDGICNHYTLNLNGLAVLDLTEYGVENWIAILMQYRKLSELDDAFETLEEAFLKQYGIDCEQYDIIIGYRADDSYFAMAKDFVARQITKEVLREALRLGLLGLQVCIKSEKAYQHLQYEGHTQVSKDKYYDKYMKRDSLARSQYKEIRKRYALKRGTYITDLLDLGE